MIYFGIGLAALALALTGMYNLLVRRRNGVDNAFAGIDTQLMMRYDLIPNLVAVVRQYASHESETLRRVTELRAQAQQQGLDSNERVQLDNRIGQAMGGILEHLLFFSQYKLLHDGLRP